MSRSVNTTVLAGMLACLSPIAAIAGNQSQTSDTHQPHPAPQRPLVYHWLDMGVLHTRTHSEMSTLVVQDGREQKGEQVMTLDITLTVASMSNDGVAKVNAKYDAVRLMMRQGENAVSVDSTQKPASDAAGSPSPTPAAKAAMALVGQSITLTISPLGEVTSVEGTAPIIAKLQASSGKDSAVVNAIAMMLEPRTLQAAWNGVLHVLPPDAIEADRPWLIESQSPMGSAGTLHIKRSLISSSKPVASNRDEKVASKEGGTLLKFTTEMTLAQKRKPSTNEEKAAGKKETEPTYTFSGAGSGEVRFDNKRGMIISMAASQEMSLRATGADGKDLFEQKAMTQTSFVASPNELPAWVAPTKKRTDPKQPDQK